MFKAKACLYNEQKRLQSKNNLRDTKEIKEEK